MESTSSPNQANPMSPTSPAVHDVDATRLAGEFESLAEDYQNVIRLAQQQHRIALVPLQPSRVSVAMLSSREALQAQCCTW